MELEHRVEMLEREMELLKKEIQATLLNVQKSLAEEPVNKLSSPVRWRKRAWVLALLNVLVAITLFTNIRFYASDTPAGASSLLEPWLRAFWVVLMFVWLTLQLYPLALLLERENKRSREAAWRNVGAILFFSPGLTIALTLLVLAVAAISMLIPSLWLVAMAVLFAGACANAVEYLLRPYRRRVHEADGKRKPRF